MRFTLVTLVLAAPALLIATPGQAQSLAAADLPDRVLAVTADAIQARDWPRAEAALNAALRDYPDRPELLLNLARVYAETGRPAKARALSYRVLRQDPIPLGTASGATADSHALARRTLHHLAASND